MSEQDREAFDGWVKGESTFTPNTHGDDNPTYVMWTAWKAARDHYAPKLTEWEVKVLASKAMFETPGEDEDGYRDFNDTADAVISALRAAGLRFKEEA